MGPTNRLCPSATDFSPPREQLSPPNSISAISAVYLRPPIDWSSGNTREQKNGTVSKIIAPLRLR